MDRLTRKELKRDPFAFEMQHGFEFLTTHRQQSLKYGGIALAVIAVAVGLYYYRQHEQAIRQDLLATALRTNDASVGDASNPYAISFPTQQAKVAAVNKAFTDVATRFPGTDEGTVAQFFLASQASDKGDMAQAERRFKDIVDNGSGPYVALGKVSLATLYAGEGKLPEAEKLLRSVMDKPNALVSKEQASIKLAEILAPTRPNEARALLGPLRASDRAAVSRAAIDAYTQLKLN